MASAADIIVNLVAKTARFEKGMKRASKDITRMSRAAQTAQLALRTVGTAIAALGAGRVVAAIRQQLTFAGNLQRVAEVVGFTTEQVQELRFAAEQLNIGTKQVDLGMQRFSRRIAEVAQGQGELLKVAQKYNVQLRDNDGNMRNNIDLLRDFANIVQNAESEQEQLRIAFKLFDSEGASLVRLLRKGSAGVDEFARAAHDAGVVVSNSLVAKAAEADRRMVELSQTMQAKLLVAVAENSDAFVTMGEAIGTAAAEAVGLLGQITAMVNLAAKSGGEGIARLIVGNEDSYIRAVDRVEELNRQLEKARQSGEKFGKVKLGQFDFDLSFLNVVAPKIQYDIPALEAEIAEQQRIIDGYMAHVRLRSQEIAQDISSTTVAAITVPVNTEALNEIDVSEAIQRANTFLDRRKRLYDLINGSRTQEEIIANNIRFINDAILNGEGDRVQLLETQKRLQAELIELKNAEVSSIIASTRTQDEAAIKRIITLNTFILKGEGDINAAIEARTRILEGLGEQSKEQFETLTEFGVQAARNLQDSFADFFKNMKGGFKGILKSFVNLLRDMVAQLLARQVLLSFFGALSGAGGGLGKFAKAVIGGITKRQAGGPLAVGQAAIVGERGPELFVPSVAGTVIPRGAGGRGGANVTIVNHNNFTNADSGLIRQMPALLEQQGQLIMAQVRANIAEGRM